MQADRQTDRQTDHNTSHPPKGKVINEHGVHSGEMRSVEMRSDSVK